jgi:predicted DNA-binding transcriptional regulator AlpA
MPPIPSDQCPLHRSFTGPELVLRPASISVGSAPLGPPAPFANLDPFVPMKLTCRLTSLSERQIRRMIAAGEFPLRVKISRGRYAFKASDLIAWAEARPAA